MVLGFSTKKKPSLPMYEEQKDTPWITRNRELNETSYGNLNRDLNNVNVFDDATRQQLNAYNDSIYNRAVSDFDRDYTQTMNKYLSRDYNRFGTTGGTSSLLNRDNYNLTQQRKLADMEYNRAMNYENMVNQELARRYQWLNTNNQLFNTSGGITQNFDDANWKIRLQNQDRAYENAVQDYNNSLEHVTDKLAHQIGGAVSSIWLGPAGLAMGDAMSNAFASDAQSMLSGKSYGYGSGYTNTFNNAMQAFGSAKGFPGWSGTNNSSSLRGDQVTNYYNPWQQLLNQYSYGTSDPRGGFGNVDTSVLDVIGNLYA